MAQVEGRLGLILIGMGMLNSAQDPAGFEDRRRRFDAITRGWLLARKAKPLFGVRWNELWEHPLEQLRAEFGIALDEVDQPGDGGASLAPSQGGSEVLSSAA